MYTCACAEDGNLDDVTFDQAMKAIGSNAKAGDYDVELVFERLAGRGRGVEEGIGYGLRRGRARKIDDRGGAKRVDDVVAVSLSTVERTNGANGRQGVFGKIAVETARRRASRTSLSSTHAMSILADP